MAVELDDFTGMIWGSQGNQSTLSCRSHRLLRLVSRSLGISGAKCGAILPSFDQNSQVPCKAEEIEDRGVKQELYEKVIQGGCFNIKMLSTILDNNIS